MKSVLVIVPTYNEASNIEHVVTAIEQVAKHSDSHNFRLLVVDDESPDGTSNIVRDLQKRYGNIHLISGKKAGLGRAYIRGLRYGLKAGDYDVFVLMDADRSHSPEDIPALLKAIDKGADYVIGSRYVPGGAVAADWPLRRAIASRAANFIAHRLTGITDDIADVTGGFKAIRREALSEINFSDLNARGYIFQVSLLHAFIRKGYRVREVPITFTDRQYGASKLRARDIIEFIYRAYKLDPNAPVQRFARFGLVGACGSVVNIVILSFLIRFGHVNAILADAIAIEGSILFNFFLNHYYTFRGYGSNSIPVRKTSLHDLMIKMGKFNLGSLGGALISFSIFTLLYKYFNVNYILADIFAIVIAMSWNYWMSTRFVWKAIDEESAG